MRRLEQSRPFANAVEEATVNLLVTASWLDDRVERTLEPLGITHANTMCCASCEGHIPRATPARAV